MAFSAASAAAAPRLNQAIVNEIQRSMVPIEGSKLCARMVGKTTQRVDVYTEAAQDVPPQAAQVSAMTNAGTVRDVLERHRLSVPAYVEVLVSEAMVRRAPSTTTSRSASSGFAAPRTASSWAPERSRGAGSGRRLVEEPAQQPALDHLHDHEIRPGRRREEDEEPGRQRHEAEQGRRRRERERDPTATTPGSSPPAAGSAGCAGDCPPCG